MFSELKVMLAGLVARVRAPRLEEKAAQQRVLLVLAQQARAAQGPRQLAVVGQLALLSLPAQLLPVLGQVVAARLLALQQAEPAKSRSRRSSSSRTRRAKSTTRQRRAR